MFVVGVPHAVKGRDSPIQPDPHGWGLGRDVKGRGFGRDSRDDGSGSVLGRGLAICATRGEFMVVGVCILATVRARLSSRDPQNDVGGFPVQECQQEQARHQGSMQKQVFIIWPTPGSAQMPIAHRPARRAVCTSHSTHPEQRAPAPCGRDLHHTKSCPRVLVLVRVRVLVLVRLSVLVLNRHMLGVHTSVGRGLVQELGGACHQMHVY